MNTCFKKSWFQGYLYRFYCINISILESKCDSHVEFLNETNITYNVEDKFQVNLKCRT